MFVQSQIIGTILYIPSAFNSIERKRMKSTARITGKAENRKMFPPSTINIRLLCY